MKKVDWNKELAPQEIVEVEQILASTGLDEKYSASDFLDRIWHCFNKGLLGGAK